MFEGVDIQPKSDTPGTTQTESTDHDESSSDGDSFSDNGGGQRNAVTKPRSPYRRNQFKFKKSEPNRVWVQLTIQKGKTLQKTNVFDVNFDQLTC